MKCAERKMPWSNNKLLKKLKFCSKWMTYSCSMWKGINSFILLFLWDDWDNPVCPRTPGDATPSDRLSSEGLPEGSGSSTPSRLMSAGGSRDTSSNPSQASSSSTNRTPPDGQPSPTDAMRRMSITAPGSETPPTPPERRDSPPRVVFESNLPFIAGNHIQLGFLSLTKLSFSALEIVSCSGVRIQLSSFNLSLSFTWSCKMFAD